MPSLKFHQFMEWSYLKSWKNLTHGTMIRSTISKKWDRSNLQTSSLSSLERVHNVLPCIVIKEICWNENNILNLTKLELEKYISFYICITVKEICWNENHILNLTKLELVKKYVLWREAGDHFWLARERSREITQFHLFSYYGDIHHNKSQRVKS